MAPAFVSLCRQAVPRFLLPLTPAGMPVQVDFQKRFDTYSHQRLLSNTVTEQEGRSLHCLITNYKSKD